MSDLTLARKVESALTGYMETIITSGLNIYSGHDKAATVTIPYLVIYAEDTQPHPDLPTYTGVRIVTTRFEVRVDSEVDTDRSALDGWRKTIEDALGSVPTILAALNAPASGTDAREITDIHIYDILAANEPTEMDRADWVEQITVGVVAQPLDIRSA
jgi:hypothetical protein